MSHPEASPAGLERELGLLLTEELRNSKEDFFGVEGIQQAIVERVHLPLKDLAQEVLAGAARFSSRPQPDDDLTLFLMRASGSREVAPEPQSHRDRS